ncbi:MAG: PAS domain S-box protein [Deltaproteobacteria bacterium]|nr:PAS domain S-box protein [Deltaproteobacteria bacterium]
MKGISLKWKLLIPFLFFAFAGTSILTTINLVSQHKLIRDEERKGLRLYYERFLEEFKEKSNQAMSLAVVIAENRQVQLYLAEKDRAALIKLLMPIYVELKMDFDIAQLHLHLPDAVSFLRLHGLELFGDDLSDYRKTIMDALRTRRTTGGLEKGLTGFGIRGVAPVFLYEKIVGTVEIGHSFDRFFLERIHEKWGVDLALYEVDAHQPFKVIARVGKELDGFNAQPHLCEAVDRGLAILVAPRGYKTRSILFGALKNYSGQTVAVLEINIDRSAIRERLSETGNLMMVIGAIGIAVSFLLTYLVAVFFIRPIKEIVMEAQDIAQEKRDSRLNPGPGDEIGTLTEALNLMLESLKEKRVAIENYAKTLEKRVEERTADLVASEEKYRTLVEHVPLIVYRVLEDGTTEFVNSYLTECLGYTIEEAVRDRTFWQEKICGFPAKENLKDCLVPFKTGEESRSERIVKDKEGRWVTFIDHAIPSKDGEGRIEWVDGIMLDITELKILQEQALRGEEIRILGEISAHMAHEIRNPLISAGGFARRLRDSLEENDQNRKIADIIVNEVTRLENFLRTLLSSIQPFDLALGEVSVNDLLESCVSDLKTFLDGKGCRVKSNYESDIQKIQGDKERLYQAFKNLLKHALVSVREGETIFLSTGSLADRVVVSISHRIHRLSQDDLDKFFFPHIEEEMGWEILDLPLSRIIIHRHGGKVDLIQKDNEELTLRIELPVGSSAS